MILTIQPNGVIGCFYTEAIDLRELGELTVSRASHVEFNHDTQQWEVRNLVGVVLHQHPSRAECLEWEQQHFDT
jgi:hypothetical protein